MKRIILSMLLLITATTYAQVGINEEDPKATLDIKAKSLNTEDNLEGLLIPRVSINKALQMGNNPEIEVSTMIYVNDLTDYTTSPADAKVADVTENGFYFWNGTKWVRSIGSNGEEWVYNPTTKRIDLRRSGQDTNFTNKVFYDTNTGQKISADILENVEVGGLDDNYSYEAPTVNISDYAKNINTSLSQNLPIYTEDKYKKKRLNYNSINITQDDNFGNEEGYVKLSTNELTINNNNSNNYRGIYNTSNVLSLGGSGTLRTAIANHTFVVVSPNQKIGSAVAGSFDDVWTTGSSTVRRSWGISTRVTNAAESSNQVIQSTGGRFNLRTMKNGYTKDLRGIDIKIESASENTSQGGILIAGIHNVIEHTGKVKYQDIYGIKNEANIGAGAQAPDNLYGLYLGDAIGATDKNYSIYTNAGNIRFGDLKGTGERVVIADNDGVLDTKSLTDIQGTSYTNGDGIYFTTDASSTKINSLWKQETTSNSIILKVNSAGADRESSPGASRNDVSITDEGKVLAKAFIGYNGASIFPDYVFEKYYNGYSDIKADYNFHNLTSVESFIKKNGHLPGYKSAREIAKEGLIDLSATQLTNVEKIEELYLHLIEKEKEVQELKAELQSQKEDFEARLERLEKLLDK